MKLKISVLSVFLISSLVFLSCANKDDELTVLQLTNELIIEEIEPDVFLVTHSYPWPANSLLLVLDKNNILWIDTPYTPEAASLVLDWIQKDLGKSYNIIEINTGFHIDNLGGNQELIKRNIPIYGSDLTCELLETRSDNTTAKMLKWLKRPEYEKYRDVYSNFSFYSPTRIFDINEEQEIKIGTEEIVIFYPGPSHTYDNLVVYIPEKELLFGGCMVLSSGADKVGFIEDGNLDEWKKSLLILEKRFEKIRLVVPGHGDPGGPALLSHTIEILNADVN